MSAGDVHDARKFLEAKGLPELLERFVLDCAKSRPDDLASFMAQWAVRNGGKVPSPSSMGQQPKAQVSTQRVRRVLLLGSQSGREHAFKNIVEASTLTRPSESLREAVAAIRDHFEKDLGLSIVGLPGDHETIVMLSHDEIGPRLMRALAVADGVLFCVTEDDASDLQRRREGMVAQYCILAHAAGLRAAAGAVVVRRLDAASQDSLTIRAALKECMTVSGFNDQSVVAPVEAIHELHSQRAKAFGALLSALPLTPPQPHGPPTVVKSIDATVVLLPAAKSVQVGAKMTAYCCGSCEFVLDKIVCLIDRRSGKVIDKQPSKASAGEVAILRGRLIGYGGRAAVAATDAPFCGVMGGGVAAVGTVSKLEADDAASSSSEVEISEDSSDASFDLGGAAGDEFHIDD